jgi:endonuclease/exonuclease/phosphatase family metal-dependent hydrolase
MAHAQWSPNPSVQVTIEVEVVPPLPPPAALEEVEAAGRDDHADHLQAETSTLLGSAHRHAADMGIEAHGGGPRLCRAWRRCSVWQCSVTLAVFSAAVLAAAYPLADACFYWLALAAVVGSAWLCIRPRAMRLPVVARAPQRQPRAQSGGRVRILSLNMCLLPAGINFSGRCLCDGDDRKGARLSKLEDLIDEFDIVLLNELWGSPWSSHHARFTATALSKGFDVVTDPISCIFNTGNMILSRFPLRDASSVIFAHHAGWQSMVPNGVLHATCQLPTGEPLHLFTTHLQCTTAPPAALRPPASPSAADSINTGVLDLLEQGEKVSGGKCDSVRKGQLLEIKAFMDAVIPTRDDKFVLGGDLNIEGGTPEYAEMTRIFGYQSLCAPGFRPTYNTDSFLTPPGWRGVWRPRPRPWRLPRPRTRAAAPMPCRAHTFYAVDVGCWRAFLCRQPAGFGLSFQATCHVSLGAALLAADPHTLYLRPPTRIFSVFACGSSAALPVHLTFSWPEACAGHEWQASSTASASTTCLQTSMR